MYIRGFARARLASGFGIVLAMAAGGLLASPGVAHADSITWQVTSTAYDAGWCSTPGGDPASAPEGTLAWALNQWNNASTPGDYAIQLAVAGTIVLPCPLTIQPPVASSLGLSPISFAITGLGSGPSVIDGSQLPGMAFALYDQSFPGFTGFSFKGFTFIAGDIDLEARGHALTLDDVHIAGGSAANYVPYGAFSVGPYGPHITIGSSPQLTISNSVIDLPLNPYYANGNYGPNAVAYLELGAPYYAGPCSVDVANTAINATFSPAYGSLNYVLLGKGCDYSFDHVTTTEANTPTSAGPTDQTVMFGLTSDSIGSLAISNSTMTSGGSFTNLHLGGDATITDSSLTQPLDIGDAAYIGILTLDCPSGQCAMTVERSLISGRLNAHVPSVFYGGGFSSVLIEDSTLYTAAGLSQGTGSPMTGLVLPPQSTQTAVTVTLTNNTILADPNLNGGVAMALLQANAGQGAVTLAASNNVIDSGACAPIVGAGGPVTITGAGNVVTSNDTCQGGYTALPDGSYETMSTATMALGPLADNGGATKTFKPAPGSPLIDTGDTAACAGTCAASDQRGLARVAGGSVDVGAVETQPGVITISPAKQTVTGGATAVVTLHRAGGSDGAVTVTVATADGTATQGVDYVALSQPVTWADGDTADKPVKIKTIDALTGQDPDFTVAISAAAAPWVIGADRVATVNIVDQAPPAQPQVEPSAQPPAAPPTVPAGPASPGPVTLGQTGGYVVPAAPNRLAGLAPFLIGSGLLVLVYGRRRRLGLAG